MEKPSSGSSRERAETAADTSGETQLAIPAPQAEAVARRANAANAGSAIPRESSARLPSEEADSMIGRTVDHYTVHSHLGGGGMGVVYKAEDSRLQRTLALKFLPSSLTRDAVAKSRFLQEARAASALDHPNVCTIYDIGESDDGRLYLAMPAYDGETLKKKIERGPLPIDEAVGFATQIAQGLAKAHRQGIVHRDIKPANLMVTSDGIVKILDFGLAKLAGAVGLTRAGFCVGTPSYMSPEQARGEVDHRTDLWSLGVVLYEMLTGLTPFRAESDPGIVHALLHDEPPPLTRWRPEAPPALQQIVTGLLQKNLADRYPAAESLLQQLRAVGGAAFPGASLTEMPAKPPRPPRKSRGLVAALALGLIAALATAGWLLLSRMQDRPPGQDSPVAQLTQQEGSERQPSLGGDFFVYTKRSGGDDDIFWERVDGDNPLNLTADFPGDDSQAAISPDGQQIAFRSERSGGGIFLMGSTGESPRRLVAFGHSPAWSPDGTELVIATEGVTKPDLRASTSQVWRVGVLPDGGKTLLARGDAVQPAWSPDGGRIAYWSISADTGERALWTMRKDGSDPVRVVGGEHHYWNPAWSPDGRYLYFVSDLRGSMNLWRVRLDQGSGRVLGEPEPVQVPTRSISGLTMGRDGHRILYATDDSKANVEKIELDPVSGEVRGEPVPVTRGSLSVRSADLSPDGKWVVFDLSAPQEDLYVIRIDGTGLLRLTNDSYKDRIPRWSPDGASILFYSNRSGKYDAWKIRADGSDRARLTDVDQPVYNPLWSPDDRWLVFNQEFQEAVLIDLAEPLERRRPRPLPNRSGTVRTFAPDSWSADGKWLAGYTSSNGIDIYSFESGRFERLTDRGSHVVWLPGSQRLLFLDGGRLFLFDRATRQARELLTPPEESSLARVGVSRDGRTVCLVRQVDEGDVWMLTLD